MPPMFKKFQESWSYSKEFSLYCKAIPKLNMIQFILFVMVTVNSPFVILYITSCY